MALVIEALAWEGFGILERVFSLTSTYSSQLSCAHSPRLHQRSLLRCSHKTEAYVVEAIACYTVGTTGRAYTTGSAEPAAPPKDSR